MDTQLQSLSKIFTERLFRIPDYQRGYAWTEKELLDFWGDIQQLDAKRNHYTGVLTLEHVQPSTYQRWEEDLWIIEARNYQPFYVVDGQQRLTTAVILVQVILEKVKGDERLNYTDVRNIKGKFIFDSKEDDLSRSYIFGYEKDNPSYEFLKSRIFGERSSTNQSEETVYTQNLSAAKRFLERAIKDFDKAELEVLYRKVTQQLLFNIFTITEDVDVCVAFETMNNRGKPLSCLELLKNRLIYLALKLDERQEEQRVLRGEINECWKTMYHNLGRNREKPLDDDEFLLTHYTTYFGSPGTRLRSESDGIRMSLRLGRGLTRDDVESDLLRNRFVVANISANQNSGGVVSKYEIKRYVNSLQDAIRIWYDIWNPMSSSFDLETRVWLEKLNRLGMENISSVLLLFFQYVSSEALRHRFLRSIERFVFISSLGNVLYHDSIFVSITGGEDLPEAGEVEDWAENVISRIEFFATDFAQSAVSIDLMRRQITDRGFDKWPKLKYFLYEYNLSLQEASKTSRPKIDWETLVECPDDYISVEHIYPKSNRVRYWQSMFKGLKKEQKDSLRRSLGNLLPLSKPKNASLSDRPFPEKAGRTRVGKVSYKYGSYAEIEVCDYDDWNPAAIRDRGLKLLEFMERRWDISLGDENNKLRWLGVEFVK